MGRSGRRALDHESAPSYQVSVQVDDGAGGSDTINVTVQVADVDEPPPPPAAPTMVAAIRTSLEVRWSAPANPGRPAIESYDLQSRESGGAAFLPGPQNVAGTRTWRCWPTSARWTGWTCRRTR